MKLTILNTMTGETVDVDSPFNAYWWACGNGSCDCNRATEFPDEVDAALDAAQQQAHPELEEWQGLCYGCERFLIVAADTDEYTLDELNADYPDALKAQWLGETHGPTA